MFDEVIEHNRRSHMKLMMTKGMSNPIVQTIAAVGLAGVLYLATVDAINGLMSVGEFTSFIAALMLITAPLRRLVNVAGPLQQGIAAAQSIFEVLDAPLEDQGGSFRLERARGEVEYRNVEFKYPTAADPVLHGVSFHAQPGEKIAIVGRSGSGKSTLVGLLPRFYDPTAGQVLVDGHDAREFALDALRAQVSLVSQDVVLFNDTIKSNIAFGFPATDAEIEAAAATARVNEFSDAIAARARHRRGRSRHAAVGWPAPAHRDRARAAAQLADPDPGRGDLGARHRDRTPDPGPARSAHGQPHDAHHRAPPVDGREGRPHPGHGCRDASWNREPTRNCWRATASTPCCTGCSSTTDACRSTRGCRASGTAPPGAACRCGRWPCCTALILALRALAYRSRLASRRTRRRAGHRRRQPDGRRHRQDTGRRLACAAARGSRPAGRRRPARLRRIASRCTQGA